MARRAPRESVFAGGPELYRADHQSTCSSSLLECVQTFDDVCAEAHDAQQLLRNGTFDLPRMNNILQNQRIFLFVNESTVRTYKADLAEEVEPQILELVERAKKGLKQLERQHGALKAKVGDAPSGKLKPARTAVGRIEARRLQTLVSRREALEDELRILQSELDDGPVNV